MSDSTLPATNDLLLKVTPPRVPRGAILRSALGGGPAAAREHPVLLVQAPPGFGKTLLLAQWRREHLAHGAAVAWVLAQSHDEPTRFVQSLALAVRVGAGRPTFGHALLQTGGPGGLEGVTAWLAEVAQSALNLVLVVDEADRLPAETRDALAYLLHNAPPNLRCIVAARTDCQLGLDDLVAYGECVVVGTAQLRFTLEETLQLARNRFGDAFDPDAAARLHELAEGWPLGLQLALSVATASGRELPQAPLRGTGLRSQLLEYLLGNLAPADLDFLTRISLADPLHPDLCSALVPQGDAPEHLRRLLRDTPVFVASEQSDWLRLHSLAAEALRERFAAMPEAEQRALHGRASDWLAEHGLLEAAARHALDSGQHQKAYELAERSLYESLMTQGRQGSVLDWLGRLPPDELDRRPRLLLAAAWSLALSERNDEAQQWVARILSQAGVDDSLRCECALILGGAAVFADDPDRFALLHDPWAEAPPLDNPLLLLIHANRTAYRALLDGEPALARLRQQQAPRGSRDTPPYLARWGDFIIALTYLWEGQVLLAEQLLRPAVATAEADLGRRSSFASSLAALLSAALWERDQPEEAAALLANRLDVLERGALPESVLLGFRTISRIAVASQDSEHRALELLGAMDAVGIARKLPRLRIASLSDQVRLHARRYRAETCRDLCQQIDAVFAQPETPRGPLWQRSAAGLRLLAQGYAAIAAQDWRGAVQPLADLEAVALKTRQGRVRIEALALRAWVLDRCGEKSQDLLREAVGLAEAGGLRRVFADAHPGLADWLRASHSGATRSAPAVPPQVQPAQASRPAAPRAAPSMALTPKEREVLELLARNLSNKEIGLAMQVGEETIKWHMKNLFAKLDAGTRKQVVSRARILGLLADTATN